ncbi:MAG: hypothetical protein L6Q54_15710 [Leptospiraceae bacterium]|nr:hypothetical protein [Leptospiraceae bacterium]
MENSEERGRQASIDGFTHEHIVVGLLMKKYRNISLVDLPLSPYDIIIALKDKGEEEEIIRCQVKTARTSISFTGGTRGGVDREYKSDVKTYIQSTKTSDIVIGIHPIDENTYDLYFLPTIIIEQLDQKSIAISKVERLKNNYEILERCKDKKFIISKAKECNIL